MILPISEPIPSEDSECLTFSVFIDRTEVICQICMSMAVANTERQQFTLYSKCTQIVFKLDGRVIYATTRKRAFYRLLENCLLVRLARFLLLARWAVVAVEVRPALALLDLRSVCLLLSPLRTCSSLARNISVSLFFIFTIICKEKSGIQ